MIAVLMKVNNVAQHKFNYALDCFRKVYLKNSLSNLKLVIFRGKTLLLSFLIRVSSKKIPIGAFVFKVWL